MTGESLCEARFVADLMKNGKEMSRDAIERTAHIIGPNSAAGAALREADEYAGDVRFWRLRDHIILERLP